MVYITKLRTGFLRAITVLIIICMGITGLSACGKKYAPIPSTEDDLRVVMTIDGFEVPYEQYRYFFLNYKKEIEDGNPTIWDGPQAAELEAELEKAVISALKGVYATLSLCNEYGININDAVVKEYVNDFIVETINEFGGRDKYLKELASKNMNDSTFRFFMGLDKCESELYAVLTTGLNIIPSDEESVMTYLNSDSMIRVVHILIQNDEGDDIDDNRALAEDVLAKALSGDDFNSLIRDYSEDYLMTTDGYYITPLDMIEAFEKAAYELEVNEISDVVETYLGFHIIKRLPKSSTYISKHFDELKLKYLNSEFYSIIEEKKKTLNHVPTEFYKSLSIKTVQ
ncbi:MAG: hypothetical protein GX303_08925 [Clostridiales bacterium]|nr:hypothetical protein [Clostridiales bacterium]